jgi:hypothetical protein
MYTTRPYSSDTKKAAYVCIPFSQDVSLFAATFREVYRPGDLDNATVALWTQTREFQK